MVADLGKASARQDEGVPRPRGGAHAARPMRSTVAGLVAAAVVVTVIPLVLVQVPDAIAWSLPGPGLCARPAR